MCMFFTVCFINNSNINRYYYCFPCDAHTPSIYIWALRETRGLKQKLPLKFRTRACRCSCCRGGLASSGWPVQTTMTAPAVLAATLLLLGTAATAGRQPDVGCYWYPKQCAEPGMALTDRNISDLPLDSCTYLDLGNLCFFNVTAEGTLNHGGTSGWTGKAGGSWPCKQAMETVLADVLAAKKRHPGLQAYYELWDVTPAYGDAPSGHMFVKVFSNATLLERFVGDRESPPLHPRTGARSGGQQFTVHAPHPATHAYRHAAGRSRGLCQGKPRSRGRLQHRLGAIA
jgi:hypothetical protein